MAPRPQRKPEAEPGQPGLKIVEPQGTAGKAEPAAKKGHAAESAREAEAAARRRLHPARIWPD